MSPLLVQKTLLVKSFLGRYNYLHGRDPCGKEQQDKGEESPCHAAAAVSLSVLLRVPASDKKDAPRIRAQQKVNPTSLLQHPRECVMGDRR